MALAALATLIGAALQSATGFGFALVLGPVAFAVFDPADALVILLLCGALLCVVVLFAERREREIRGQVIGLVLLAALPGLFLGVLVLEALPKATLQVAVGVCVLGALAIQVATGERTPGSKPRAGGSAYAAAVGLITGILTTTTSTNGPPLVLWLRRAGLTPAQTRDSLAAAFLGLDLLGVAVLPLFGDTDPSPDAGSLLLLAGLTILGAFIGRGLFLRLDPERFRLAGLALVGAAGVAGIVAGLS